MAKQQSKELRVNLITKPPTFAIDGHIINVTDQNVADIIFFQVSKQERENIDVNGVSSVRMTVSHLKALSEAITSTIQNHKKKLKEQQSKK